MKIQLEMLAVSKCAVEQCVYNMGRNCHAKAITIGDSTDPECDTFLRSSVHTREAKRIAGVGACKVSGCVFNHDFECAAESIAVGNNGTKIHCLTYLSRAE